MARLFGQDWTRSDLARFMPDITQVAGFRHFTLDDGAGRSMRVLQIDSGGGLRIDLLPDRTCDIGHVWCNDIPFGWVGPMGIPAPGANGVNSPLGGLMTTCGFDHVRQPERDEGRDYPMHGSMMHSPAKIVSAEPVWRGDDCAFRVIAEVAQFALDRGAMRLRRQFEIPLGGTTFTVSDHVTVLSGSIPLMALYHINLGFPLITPESVLTLNGHRIEDGSLAEDGIRVYPSRAGVTNVTLSSSPAPEAPRLHLQYDARALPFLQTFRRVAEGFNLFCLEPATHDRKPRRELRETGALVHTEDEYDFSLKISCEAGRRVGL